MTISLKPSEKTADLASQVRRWSVEAVRPWAREADTIERYPDVPDVTASCPLNVAPVGFINLKSGETVDKDGDVVADFDCGANVLSVFMTEALSVGDSWAWQMLKGGTPSEDFIEVAGTPDQVARWSNGEHVLTAIAMTEEQSGTDLAGLQTTAVRDGEEWVLNGKKTFISNLLECEWFVLLATIDPAARSQGVRAFILDKDDIAQLVVINPKEDKLGFRFMRNVTFELHDLRIPLDRCVGGPDVSGVTTAMNVFSKNRATCAVWSTSIARGCAHFAEDWVEEHAAEYTDERLTKLRSDFVEMNETLDDVVRLALRSAWLRDEGRSSTQAACYAKAVTPKLSESVALRSLQVIGAEAASERHLIEKWFRDVKMTDAMLGPSQVQRRTAAQFLIGSDSTS